MKWLNLESIDYIILTVPTKYAILNNRRMCSGFTTIISFDRHCLHTTVCQ